MVGRITVAAFLFLSVCATQVTAEPVRVAYNQNQPPLAFVKDGKPQGLSVDIIRAAAARAGIEVEMVPVPLEEMDQTLTDGRAHVILRAVTSERGESFDFSSPVVVTGGGLYARAPNPAPDSLAALSGKTVVTPRTGPLAAYIQRTAPAVKLVVTTDYEDSLARLMAGEADAAALNYQSGAIIAARLYPGQITVPHAMFLELPSAIAVPKGTYADFLRWFDAGLAAIRADGTWQQINNRWMGQ
jgi:polar amino acid transport system substrate-binding protein